MINNLSEYLVQVMLSKGYITDDEKEIYAYGMFMMISQMLLFVLTVIFGIILNCIVEATIFYIAFQLIRKYAGGYHATTETRCEILSAISIFICVLVIKISNTYIFYDILLICTSVSVVAILIFSPLDTPEKPLDSKEKKYFRKKTWIILLIILTIICLSFFLKMKTFIYPCCISLILEGVLLALGKIKEIRKKNG